MSSIKKRDYSNANPSIKEHYKNLRKHQNLKYVNKMKTKYHNFDKSNISMTILEAIDKIGQFKDNSDPDVNLTNKHHLFQTAEKAKKDNKEDWFILTCLIHDLGKVLFVKGCNEDGTSIKNQFGVVGDTFLVDYQFPKNDCVFPEFIPKIYPKKDKTIKGLNNYNCSYGHDEYLYHVLEYNDCHLPDEAFYIIRYHSLYPWHSNNAYTEIEDDLDKVMKPIVQEFQKYDLYSKNNEEIKVIDIDYYKDLIKKYIGLDSLKW